MENTYSSTNREMYRPDDHDSSGVVPDILTLSMDTTTASLRILHKETTCVYQYVDSRHILSR